MNFEWKHSTAPYTSGENLFIGKIKVGTVIHDSATARGATKIYRAVCSLYPHRQDAYLGHFEKPEEAKAEVEKAVAKWFADAGFPLFCECGARYHYTLYCSSGVCDNDE